MHQVRRRVIHDVRERFRVVLLETWRQVGKGFMSCLGMGAVVVLETWLFPSLRVSSFVLHYVVYHTQTRGRTSIEDGGDQLYGHLLPWSG